MSRSLVVVLLLSLALIPLDRGALRADDAPAATAWLDGVDLLITPREREVFLGLRSPADREAFIERFWQVRDPFPETARNEARERWEGRLAEARRRWRDLRDDRARVYLLGGEPSESFTARCGGSALEVWTYQPQFQVRFRTTLAFHLDDQPGGGPARLWRGGDSPSFFSPLQGECAADPRLAEAALWIRLVGRAPYETIVQRALAAPRPREWVSGFRPAAARPAPAAWPEPAAARPGLHLVPPAGQLVVGTQRFEVRVDRAAGLPDEEQIERVAFRLDGRPLLIRNHPPYEAQIDLGRTPRPHRITAEGTSRGGEILARDELTVNGGGQRFAVRLLEPQPGRTYRHGLRARVQVDAPEGQSVDRVELYLGDAKVATLDRPPFAAPLALPDSAAVGYVRAVAYLADGSAAEDLVLLNAPAAADKLDVRLVELYANVVDRAGKPVEGAEPAGFKVFEDGVPQPVRQVERVEDTPLKLVALIDTSASMQPRLEPTRQAALQFLRRTLRPRDQAAVITFSRAPHVAVGLTGDLAALEDGLSGMIADEETALYDSLIFSLNYLGGAAGQRAVVLLSDGEDRTSSFHFDDVLETARRAGIAIYAIGIDLPKKGASEQLARLAAETGGRGFFLRGTGDLGRACDEIGHELRSRYRITYQSSNTTPGNAFRAVRVAVEKPGLEARTISGYYP